MLTIVFAALLAAAADDAAQLRELEARWNRAHVEADVAALDALWADDITVLVPDMPAMRKHELLGFWKSGRSNIRRYETSNLAIRTWGDAAVVEGLLVRERDFNGRAITDNWRFTKTCVKQHGAWRVVSYHASPAPR